MLNIDLTGKTAFVAGVADDQGFGFAIAKSLVEAGAKVYVGTWPPVLSLFKKSMERGRLNMTMSNGEDMKIAGVIPLDVAFDTMDDVPEDVLNNPRYQNLGDYSIQGSCDALMKELGGKKLDILVHSIAQGSEVKLPFLETSRSGYIGAISASSYSIISMCQRFAPHITLGGSIYSLSYLASEKAIPGYGGGMSTAKAAMESDLNYLSYELGRAYGVRYNVISAGPLASRAGKAIGFMDKILDFTYRNQPLGKHLKAGEVGDMIAFLASPLAGAVTGTVVYVDNGFHAMGLPVEEAGPIGGDETSIHRKEGFKLPKLD